MKRIVVLLLIALSFGFLAALECINADGESIAMDARSYHYRYHTATNDYLFFGSNKWAVRFNFRNAYPAQSSTNFSIQGARLWFPNLGDSVHIELRTDQDGQPGEPVRFGEASVTESLVDIYFAEAYTAEKIWLMVSYPTNINNRWVSASHLGGNNSYYLREVGNVQILSSFASAGFNCELLFGLLGDFQLSEVDLQLCAFDLTGEMLPASRVQPRFSVYNHSAQTIDTASLNLVFSKPGAAAYHSESIVISEPIPPFSLMEYGLDTAWLPLIELPRDPTQLRVEATLSSEYAENDTLLINNKVSKAYSVFSHSMPVLLIENFLALNETGVINALQAPFLDEHYHRLQYYPLLADSLSNLPSLRRFNWYQFNSVPRTVGLGSERITGLREDYSALFQELSSSLQDRRTFISRSTCSIRAQEESENLLVDIELQNQNTNLYAGVGQSLMSNSRFFVALARKHTLEGDEHYVLERFVSFADTINVALAAGSSLSKSYSFTVSGVSTGELVDNYRLYYWVQGNAGGRIHYASFCDFRPENFVDNSDALLAVPRLELYPNPVRKGEPITLKIKGAQSGRLSIYNLRGQLLFSQAEFKGKLQLKPSDFPSSGIYLLRYEDAKNAVMIKKISIIK